MSNIDYIDKLQNINLLERKEIVTGWVVGPNETHLSNYPPRLQLAIIIHSVILKQLFI